MLTKEVLERLSKVSIDNFDAIEGIEFKKIRNITYQNSPLYLEISKRFIEILKRTHEPLGNWSQNPLSTNPDFGVVINGKWNRLMTIDTNYNGQLFLFRQCNIFLNRLQQSGVKRIKIKEKEISTELIHIPYSWDSNIKLSIEKIFLLLEIIEYNASDWLVPGHKICDDLLDVCYNVMVMGEAAEKVFQMYDHNFFTNYSEIRYTKGLGDMMDRKEGSDMWVYYSDGTIETNQIKFGHCWKDDEFYVTKSNFYPTSKSTYFTIVSNKEIFFIKNDKTMKSISDLRCFEPSSVIKIINIMDIQTELRNLIIASQKMDFDIEITKTEEKNSVTFDVIKKTVFINFVDENDDSIISSIVETTQKLKDLIV